MASCDFGSGSGTIPWIRMSTLVAIAPSSDGWLAKHKSTAKGTRTDGATPSGPVCTPHDARSPGASTDEHPLSMDSPLGHHALPRGGAHADGADSESMVD